MLKFGFSYVGFIYLIMLIVPNFVWTKYKPDGYSSDDESTILFIFERLGQVFVTCIVLMFSNFNINNLSYWGLWLVASGIFMVMYECWWIRYFKSTKTLKDFYSSFCGIPVAGATLPIIAFILLGIYGKVICLVLSCIILGIGHIGIHLEHLKKLEANE